VTAVRNILCATNFQLILDEFLSELDLDIVIQEVGVDLNYFRMQMCIYD